MNINDPHTAMSFIHLGLIVACAGIILRAVAIYRIDPGRRAYIILKLVGIAMLVMGLTIAFLLVPKLWV